MDRVAEGVYRHGAGLRIEFRFQGKRYRETDKGPGDAKHIKRAIKRRDWLLSRLKVGLPILEQDVEKPTLGQQFEKWNKQRTCKRSSKISDANIWRNYWSHWDTFTADHITTDMIRDALDARDVKNKTKKNALACLRGTLNYCNVNPNPCAPIKFGRSQKEPVERYLPEEVDALLAVLDGEAKVYFTVMAATGARPSELLALEWSDWNGERLSITKGIVRHKLEPSTKNYERRKTLVPQWARQTLNEHTTRFKGGHIFQNTLGRFHVDTDDFNDAWKRAHEKARVPYRIPYTLRHTRAAELLSTGSSDYALFAKELGHSLEMFLRTYSEWIEDYAQPDTSVLEGVRGRERKAK